MGTWCAERLGAMEERRGGVVRANEGENGRSTVTAAVVFVGPPAVGGRLPRPLLDDGNGAPGSASRGREKWLATVPGCGEGCWGCC